MKNKIFIISIISLIVDQIIKFFVSKYLTSATLIPGFLSLIYVKNYGVAFNMLFGNRILILLVSIALTAFILYLIKGDYKDNKITNTNKIVYGLLLGGVFGNMLDRIIRGYVVDYISFSIFKPIFNLADILITLSVFILALTIIIKKD